MIATILLIPSPEHAALLADGPCGARPPMMLRWKCGCGHAWWTPGGVVHGCPRCPACADLGSIRGTGRALVLAHSRRVERHGCLALADNALAKTPSCHNFAAVCQLVLDVLNGETFRLGLHSLVEVHWPGCTLVYLDSVGAEVSP